jgi:hypothetical protein
MAIQDPMVGVLLGAVFVGYFFLGAAVEVIGDGAR